MRRLQTFIVLVSICFLIDSCARKHGAPPAAAASAQAAPVAGKAATFEEKGPACCTVTSRTAAMTKR